MCLLACSCLPTGAPVGFKALLSPNDNECRCVCSMCLAALCQSVPLRLRLQSLSLSLSLPVSSCSMLWVCGRDPSSAATVCSVQITGMFFETQLKYWSRQFAETMLNSCPDPPRVCFTKKHSSSARQFSKPRIEKLFDRMKRIDEGINRTGRARPTGSLIKY